MAVKVQTSDFDLGAEVAAIRVQSSDIGAIVTFSGTVRSDSPDFGTLTLEHYPGMTERELERIEHEAHKRWPLKASLIIHRYGPLEPGDNIVLVITASGHRQAAFEAAEFLMDYLKTKAPFWKKETNTAGDGNWVDARDSDDEARARWES